MPANNTEIEKRLWDAADELRANSRLRPSEYYLPVLGLIFLRYADHKFAQADREIQAERAAVAIDRRRRPITQDDYHARGVLYLPDEARFGRLVELPEGEKIGRAINEAMKAVEAHNPDLKDVLPKTYNRPQDLQPPGQRHPRHPAQALPRHRDGPGRRRLWQDLRVLSGPVRYE
jgi:type I restriction enzyme M protein